MLVNISQIKIQGECHMKLLVLREKDCDFTEVLESCGVKVDKMTMTEATNADISQYDASAQQLHDRCRWQSS